MTSAHNTVPELIAQLKLFEDGEANGDAVIEAALALLIALAQDENLKQTAWLLSLVRSRFRSEMPRP